MFVFGRIHVTAQLVGGLPEFFFEAEVGSIVLLCIIGFASRHPLSNAPQMHVLLCQWLRFPV